MFNRFDLFKRIDKTLEEADKVLREINKALSSQHDYSEIEFLGRWCFTEDQIYKVTQFIYTPKLINTKLSSDLLICFFDSNNSYKLRVSSDKLVWDIDKNKLLNLLRKHGSIAESEWGELMPNQKEIYIRGDFEYVARIY